MATPTVSAGIFGGILDYAVMRGYSRTQLLEHCEVNEEALEDADARIDLAVCETLIHQAIRLTSDSAFPLRYATQAQIQEVSVVGLIVHSSKTMADSFVQLNRYSKLMVDFDIMDGGERFGFDMNEKGELWIVDNRPNPNLFPELTELAFGHLTGEFGREFSETPFAIEIHVTHAPPPHADEYETLLGAPTKFNAQRNAVCIDPKWLEMPFDGIGTYAFGVFTQKADELIAELENDKSMRGQIEAHVLPKLHHGAMVMDNVASDLGMSRQTLYRRLKDEDVTFAQIHDDLRHRMATDYLLTRKVSVNETAYLVGFSEASSFVRAFKRWTGLSPKAFRESAVEAV